MLEGSVEPQLQRLGIDPTDLRFQQDGATAHTAQKSMAVVREMIATVICCFGDRLVTFFPVEVPERPCVPEAYHDYSRTQAIVDKVAAIDEDLRRCV
jgi:hypothetical protein